MAESVHERRMTPPRLAIRVERVLTLHGLIAVDPKEVCDILRHVGAIEQRHITVPGLLVARPFDLQAMFEPAAL